MYIKVFLCFIILLPFKIFAQDTAFIKEQAARYATSTFNGDHQTVIDLTYPALVELSGGREMMQKLITDKIETLKKRGIIKFAGSVGSPGPVYKAGSQLHCLIPESVVLKVKGGHYTGRSYLLGISNNNGKQWWFIDAGNMPASVLHRLLPDYNDDLKIPAAGVPMFFAD